jgi:hypothetical protein
VSKAVTPPAVLGEHEIGVGQIRAQVATDTEAKEIVVQAKQFYVEVEDWITKNHPSLKM